MDPHPLCGPAPPKLIPRNLRRPQATSTRADKRGRLSDIDLQTSSRSARTRFIAAISSASSEALTISNLSMISA
eukprot:8939533-Pyramimonas_sp.AAC.1